MKRSVLFAIISFISGVIIGQTQPSEKLKQIFLDAEYFFLYEDYEEALYSYNSLYKRGFSENGNINYRIGLCYLNIPGEKNKAISYLEKAVKNANSKYTEGSFRETNAPYDAYFFLGNAYRINNDLDKAIATYNKYKEIIGPKNSTGIKLADKEIEACNNAKIAMGSPRYAKIENLGRPISTGSKDLFPAVSGNESVIVYNSAQKFYDAIYFAKKVNNKWTPPINVTPEVQSDGNQYISSLSYDGTEMFLRIEDNYEADIYMSKYENGLWSKSKSIGKIINTKFFEGNASISKDGNTLYFSSNRSGGSGAMDIYSSKRQPNGDWGQVENLGSVINTEFNEDVPFISEDGKKLFFVSQGHNTIGGYDIFYSTLSDSGLWAKPVNMGYPLNTTDDDAYFYPVLDGDVMYTNIYKKEGFGYDDIYKILLNPNLVQVNEKQDSTPQITQVIKTEPVRELPEDVIKALTDTQNIKKEPEMYILRTLFYEFNSAELTATIKKELDHLTMVLKNYPELNVKFIGHTDALGSEQYNQVLSERRAIAAKNYIITKGIGSNRITTQGMGENESIAINNNSDGSDNPDGRKLNRRVDIVFPDSNLENIKIEPIEVPVSLKIK